MIASQRAPTSFGLPGKVTPTSLTLNRGLSYEQTAAALRLIGGIGRGVAWWAVDTLLYAETHFGEDKFSQLAEELGWSAKSMSNGLWVGRSWPPKRRREGLEFGHHEALAALEEEDQEHWASLAEQGEKLPNGELRRWSVSRLRSELRALSPKRGTEPAADQRKGHSAPEPAAPQQEDQPCTPKAGPDVRGVAITPLTGTSPAGDSNATSVGTGDGNDSPPSVETARSGSTAGGASAARDSLDDEDFVRAFDCLVLLGPYLRADVTREERLTMAADMVANLARPLRRALSSPDGNPHEVVRLAKGMLVTFAGPGTFRIVALHSSPGEVLIQCAALAAVEKTA